MIRDDAASPGTSYGQQFAGHDGADHRRHRRPEQRAEHPVDDHFNIPVNITDPKFTTLSDLTVTLHILHPALNELKIVLVPPPAAGCRRSPCSTTGSTRPTAPTNARASPGPTWASPPTAGSHFGTTFSDQAVRSIRDGTAAAPYIGQVPAREGEPRRLYAGATAAQLNGTWQLADHRLPQRQRRHRCRPSRSGLTSGLARRHRQRTVAETSVRGASTPTMPNVGFPTAVAGSRTSGSARGSRSPRTTRWAPSASSRGGSTSPTPTASTVTTNQAANTDIALAVSDDGGQTWTTPNGFFTQTLSPSRGSTTTSASTDGFSGANGATHRPDAVRAPGGGRQHDRHARHVVARRPQRRLERPGGGLRHLQPRRRPDLLAAGLRQHAADRRRRDHRQAPSSSARSPRTANVNADATVRPRQEPGAGRLRRARLPGVREQPQRQHRRQGPGRRLRRDRSRSPPAPGSSRGAWGRSSRSR